MTGRKSRPAKRADEPPLHRSYIGRGQAMFTAKEIIMPDSRPSAEPTYHGRRTDRRDADELHRLLTDGKAPIRNDRRRPLAARLSVFVMQNEVMLNCC